MSIFGAIGYLLTGTMRDTDDSGHTHVVKTGGSEWSYEEYDEHGNLITAGTAPKGGGGWTSWDGKEGKWDNRPKAKGGRRS